jgi:hypothetical protein
MWRSLAIGVVLAGLLAGCSVGRGSGAVSQPQGGGGSLGASYGETPPGAVVAAVVAGWTKGWFRDGVAPKCEVVSHERATCVFPVDPQPVSFKIRGPVGTWKIRPDCASTSQNWFCVLLRSHAAEKRLRVKPGTGHCTSSTQGDDTKLTCIYISPP